jgi:hypothetical protein
MSLDQNVNKAVQVTLSAARFLPMWKRKLQHHLAAPGNPSDASSDAINCLNELSTDFCGLFNSMQFSDVISNVRGREFPAYKVILAARSEFFAAMF